jgi:4-hydroxyacetophenone monooxygenase
VRVDPDWQSDGGSVNALNEMMRSVLANGIQAQFADRPDLLEHVVPHYPPGA